MNVSFRIAALFGLFLVTRFTVARAPTQLKFSEIARLVTERNASVLNAKAQIDIARGQLGQTKSKLLPSLTSTTTYAQKTQTSKRTTTSPSATNDFASTENAISLTQTIDLFGKTQQSIRQDTATVRMQEAMYRSTLNEQIAEAQLEYLKLASAIALAEGAKADFVNAQQRLENTTTKFRVGLVPELNVLQATSDLASYDSTLATRKASVAKERIKLAQTLGISLADFGQVLLEDSPDLTNIEQTIPTLDVPAIQRRARDMHPSIQAQKFGVDAAGYGLSAARKAKLPSFSLSGNYGKNDTQSVFAFERSGSISLQISMPIYDGGQRRSQVATETANVAAAKWKLEAEVRSVESELWQAVEDYNANQKALESARRAYRSAKEALRVSELRYEQGIGTSGILEVQSAESSLITSRTQVINAYYGCIQNLVSIRKAMGEPGLAQL